MNPTRIPKTSHLMYWTRQRHKIYRWWTCTEPTTTLSSFLNQAHSEWSPQCLKDLSSSFYALLPAIVWSAQYTRKGLRCTDLTAAILGNTDITYRFLESCITDYNKAAPISKLARWPFKSGHACIAECFVIWSRFIDLNVMDMPFPQINE